MKTTIDLNAEIKRVEDEIEEQSEFRKRADNYKKKAIIVLDDEICTKEHRITDFDLTETVKENIKTTEIVDFQDGSEAKIDDPFKDNQSTEDAFAKVAVLAKEIEVEDKFYSDKTESPVVNQLSNSTLVVNDYLSSSSNEKSERCKSLRSSLSLNDDKIKEQQTKRDKIFSRFKEEDDKHADKENTNVINIPVNSNKSKSKKFVHQKSLRIQKLAEKLQKHICSDDNPKSKDSSTKLYKLDEYVQILMEKPVINNKKHKITFNKCYTGEFN